MRFGSVCSGIEAASVAWKPLGWNAAWFSEIEPFPCAVLAHRYPTVPNLGDMTALPKRIRSREIEAPDVFCGGTPCQAFSVAGQRRSLDDARGNLSLVFCEIANAIDDVRHDAGMQPSIVFWENVPGVLSTKDNAFGCFLGELAGERSAIEPPRGKWPNAGCVYGPKRAVAWRVLDAQYFGVAQRRRRVFVVASSRTGIDPAAVLFEFDSLRRDTAPSREKGEVAPTIPSRSTAGGGLGTDFDCDGGLIQTFCRQSSGEYGTQPVASTVAARDYKSASDLVCVHGTQDPCASNEVAFALGRNSGQENVIAHHLPFDTTQITSKANYSNPKVGDPCHPLSAGAHPPAIAVALRGSEGGDKAHVLTPVAYTTKLHNTKSNNAGKLFEERSPCLDANSPAPALLTPMYVRRLTPIECERLQGFPDDYTAIPWRNKPADKCPDGPRYKALGNSWAVPNVRWIGKRIQLAIEVAA